MDFADIGRLREKCGRQPLLQTAPPNTQVLPVCFTTSNVKIPSHKNGRDSHRVDAAEDGFDVDWSQAQPIDREAVENIELLAFIKVEGKNCISTLLHLLSKCKSCSSLFPWFLQCWQGAVDFLKWIR